MFVITNCTFLVRYGDKYDWGEFGGHKCMAHILLLSRKSPREAKRAWNVAKGRVVFCTQIRLFRGQSVI